MILLPYCNGLDHYPIVESSNGNRHRKTEVYSVARWPNVACVAAHCAPAASKGDNVAITGAKRGSAYRVDDSLFCWLLFA
jgi:hypothetical protein